MAAGWHPAIWWIDRRLQVEREIACDEMTVAITGSPKSYAECLIKLSTLRGAPRAMQAAPAVFTPSGLRARVSRIVSPRRSIAPVWSGTLAAAIVLVLGLVSVAVGGLTLVEATAFAQPSMPARTLPLSVPSDRLVPVAPAISSDTKTDGSPRRALARSSSPQRPKTEQPSRPPQPHVEPTAPSAPPEPSTVDSTRAADADPEPAPPAAPEGAGVPPTREALQSVTGEPRSPWTAAAAGGVALGRKSKDAGVATGGLFTRFAHGVAGSF